MRRTLGRWLRSYWRRYRTRPFVRPWALATPIVILLICLPMLRPLQHPDPREMSHGEAARLATVRAIVEDKSLAVQPSPLFMSNRFVRVGGRVYADQPPAFAVLLAPAYALLRHYGYSFENNPVLVPYLLTVLGATLPVGAVAGLVYRLGRMFELRRVWRTGLAAGVVFGSGLLAYGTALSPRAAAAALLLGSVASVVHLAVSPNPKRGGGWLVLAGFLGALAAAVDPVTLPGAIGVAGSIMAMRWSFGLRVGGVLMFVLGCLPPAALHAVLTVPLTGDLRPIIGLTEVADAPTTRSAATAPDDPNLLLLPEDFDDLPVTVWDRIGRQIERVTGGLLGSKGVLSHFPVLIVGGAGIYLILRRHWPRVFKALAAVTAVWAVGSIIVLAGPTAREQSYGPDYFIPIAPLVLLWAGAFLRREHRPATWMTAGVLMLLSLIVTVMGTADVCRRGGIDGWGPVAVFRDPTPDALSAPRPLPSVDP